jgi:hypothetical protein
MANFRPKRPIAQDSEYFYADTLENFLKRRPLKKRGKLDNSSLEMSKNTNGRNEWQDRETARDAEEVC